MIDPRDLLRRAAADLSSLGVSWAVIGGVAVGARTEPRFTRDVDIAVAVADDPEAEEMVLRLRAVGYDVASSLEQERTGRLATVRLSSPGGDPDDPVLDLLFASSGIEREVVAGAAETEVFAGQRVPVASIGHLIALKLLSEADHRSLDKADLQALIREADAAELSVAREAVRLITERGYNRDRDLEHSLDDTVARWRASKT